MWACKHGDMQPWGHLLLLFLLSCIFSTFSNDKPPLTFLPPVKRVAVTSKVPLLGLELNLSKCFSLMFFAETEFNVCTHKWVPHTHTHISTSQSIYKREREKEKKKKTTSHQQALEKNKIFLKPNLPQAIQKYQNIAQLKYKSCHLVLSLTECLF